MLGASRNASGTSTTGGQKFVILQSRSQTPTASNISTGTIQQPSQQQQQQQQQPSQPQSQSQTQQQQQVKLAQTNLGQQKAHVSGSAPKLVVVCMSASSHTNTVTQTSLTTKTQNVFVAQQNVERSISPEEEHSFQ